MAMNGEERVRQLEQRHHECNHEMSMFKATAEERFVNQSQCNSRFERCMDTLKIRMNDQDMKIRSIENKVAWWAGAAAMIGTAIPLLVKYFLT